MSCREIGDGPYRLAQAGKPGHRVCQNGSMAATKTTFTRDAGLQSRMLLTMFLLGALYVAFVGVLFAAGVQGFMILLIAGGFAAVQFTPGVI